MIHGRKHYVAYDLEAIEVVAMIDFKATTDNVGRLQSLL